MSWAIGYDSYWGRDIGYGVPAVCDSPKCNEQIDRGLAHVCCDQEPYGGDKGCGLFFCAQHLGGGFDKCSRCRNYRPAYRAKPDVPEWELHKLVDESWAQWRAEHPQWVQDAIQRYSAQQIAEAKAAALQDDPT